MEDADKPKKYLCEHGKVKYTCVKCGGKKYLNKLCEHGKRPNRCLKCGGVGLCKEHGIQKDQCAQCRTGKFYCIATGKSKKDCQHCKDMKAIRKDGMEDYKRRQALYDATRRQDDLGILGALPLIDDDFPYQEPSEEEGEEGEEEEEEGQVFASGFRPGSAQAFRSAPGSAPGFRPAQRSLAEAFGSAQGSAHFLDDVPYTGTVYDPNDPENQTDSDSDRGGRKRKKRFTRRLRRNHNTKKKSKIIKRKVTKRSRKNKHK